MNRRFVCILMSGVWGLSVPARAEVRVIPAWIGPDRCFPVQGVAAGSVTVEREQIEFQSTEWSGPVELVCPRGFQAQKNTLKFSSQTGGNDGACERISGAELGLVQVRCHKTQPNECGSASARCKTLAELTCAAVEMTTPLAAVENCRSLGALAQEGALASMVEVVNLLDRVSAMLAALQSGHVLPLTQEAPPENATSGSSTNGADAGQISNQNSAPATAVDSGPQELQFPGKPRPRRLQEKGFEMPNPR